jgi:hypothetical protein
MSFVPDDMNDKKPEIPYFEDASSELGVKGHSTSKSIDTLKMEVRAAMGSLGGGVTSFLVGHFDETPMRYGYQINFAYGDREGVLKIAGLPMRKETESKREKVLKQALYTVREMLEAQFNSGILLPGSAPLVQYLLDDQGRTLAEALSEVSHIPLLSPPMKEKGKDKKNEDEDVVDNEDEDVVEGEFSEVDE